MYGKQAALIMTALICACGMASAQVSLRAGVLGCGGSRTSGDNQSINGIVGQGIVGESFGVNVVELGFFHQATDTSGTILVSLPPSWLGTSWQLTGPAGFDSTGIEDAQIIIATPGDYIFSWFDSPGQMRSELGQQIVPIVLGRTVTVPCLSNVEFQDVAAGLPGVAAGSSVWGDYDNDGDIDLALAGGTGSGYISRVYRNDGIGVFTDIAADVPGVVASSAAWGDYDNDGDIDLALAGDTGSGYISRVYRNDAGNFVDSDAGLPGVRTGSLAWGDCDNDGDLDMVLTGDTGSSRLSRVYRNDGGVFTDCFAGLPGISASWVGWADFDNDGDSDLLLSGHTGSSRIARIYRNDSGTFTDIGAGLVGVMHGSGAWGDYDADGDLDLVLSGLSDSGYDTRIYNNDAGEFTDLVAGLPGLVDCSVAWGDYDNDGDLDVALTGYTGSEYLSRVYANDAGVFADIEAGLLGMRWSSVAWGDYDVDGDLDLVLTGYTGTIHDSRIYRNDGLLTNTVPTAPGDLTAEKVGDQLTLNWSPATDDQTPAPGLSYNLRVGTTPGGDEVYASMANPVNGYCRVVREGNAQKRTTWTLMVTGSGPYYWSVQSVDGAFAGSAFAPEETIGNTVAVFEEAPREITFALVGANPVVGSVRFRFALPTRAQAQLSIYNIAGQRVVKLVDEELAPGYHEVSWGTQGVRLRPGVYFALLIVGGREFTQRVVVLK